MAEAGPSFQRTAYECRLIGRIATRAVRELSDGRAGTFTKQDIAMDVTAAHANGNPLKLAAMLKADRSNFAHDVVGIRRHLDRSTGKLMNCFVPRFSKPSR